MNTKQSDRRAAGADSKLDYSANYTCIPDTKQGKKAKQRITALYARLSHDDEKEGISGSIQNQKVILEKFAKDNKLTNPRFFYDDGFSGVTFTRPAFMEMMELAEQGLIGTIVVKDHSRLGRNRLVVGQLLEEDFVRLDIRYIAIMDNIDTAKGTRITQPVKSATSDLPLCRCPLKMSRAN